MKVCAKVVFLLVDLFGLQKTGNTLDFSEVCHVAGILELVLIAEADLVHHVIEPFDDVEGIDTDPGIGEVLFCNGDKAIAHVAAEVFYLLALRRRELMEISVDSDAGDLVQDVDDSVSIAARDTVVILGKIHLCPLEFQMSVFPLNSLMQIVSGSFLGR